MMAIKGPTPEGIPVNFRHALSADYTTGRRTAWGGTIQFYRTEASYTGQEIDFDYRDSYGNAYSYSYYPSSKAVANITGTNLGVYVKRSRKNYIAPHGKYYKLGLTFFNYRARYNEKNFSTEYEVYEYNGWYTSGYHGIHTPELGSGNDSFRSLGLTWGRGKQRIFWDKVVVDTGFEVNYIIGSLLNALDGSETFGFSKDDYIRTGAKARIVRHNLINVTVGIGYLAK